ncbi:MAG TPA: hypothetical protein VKR27_05205 [Acidimicrobiales bacterium]|nr:hypothetical protein [Acidimicrobiales bacterium]
MTTEQSEMGDELGTSFERSDSVIEQVPAGADTTQFHVQRAVPRQPVEWNAKYRFQDSPPEERWRDCRIADISTAGVRLRLFGIKPEEAEGRGIDLLVQLSGGVRNTVPGMKKDVQVGVEFVELSGEAAKFVDSLKRSDFRW